MKAGTTNYEVGTRIRITKSNDKELIGLTGEITHPFPGLMAPKTKYTVGLRLDQKGIFSDDICNLMSCDKFEIID